MFKLLLVSCLLAVAIAAPPNHRIVNGVDIDITKVPYQVAVGNSNSIWCGGSIISKKYILTAAHCFNDHDINTETFMVFVGMTSLTAISGNMLKKVKTVNVHPDYNKQTHNVDMAILELVDSLEYNTKVQPVNLPSLGASVPIGKMAYASGWGKLTEGGASATTLQGVALELLSSKECSKYSNFDTTYMQCAGSTDGSVDTCQGDSGGPLVYNNIIYGVVSFGRGCATPGFPGVYAHVPNLRDYITEITGL